MSDLLKNTTSKIKLIDEYGYYFYNNELFGTKTDVLQAAIVNKDFSPQIKFWFHDELFSNIDWTIEPSFSLDQLYTERAHYLRNNYEYLILMYSGGADSHQVLRIFMKNNIHLDEIRSYHPVQLANSKIYNNNDDQKKFGILFEYLGLRNWFDRISKEIPKTKLSVIDYTDILNSNFYKDSFFTNFERYSNLEASLFHPIRRFTKINDITSYTASLNKKVAVIYGDDKPHLEMDGNDIYFTFIDSGRSESQFSQSMSMPYIPKMFYWSREAPLIPIKQAHILKQYFETHRKKFSEIISDPMGYPKFKMTKIFRSLIYPDYDPSIFQIFGFPVGGDHIFSLLFPDKNIFQRLDEKNKYFDQKYGKVEGMLSLTGKYRAYMKSYRSKRYKIGTL